MTSSVQLPAWGLDDSPRALAALLKRRLQASRDESIDDGRGLSKWRLSHVG